MTPAENDAWKQDLEVALLIHEVYFVMFVFLDAVVSIWNFNTSVIYLS